MQEQLILLFTILILFGGSIVWLMVFLATYPHFPRMETHKRIMLAVENATSLAVLLMAILVVAAYLLAKMVMK